MKLKKYILSLIFLGTAVFFFGASPQKAEAGTFGGLKVYTKIKYPTETTARNLNGVTVTVTPNTSGSYSGRCTGNGYTNSSTYGSRACSKAGIVNLSTSPDTCKDSTNKTSSDGYVQWLESSGVVFSSCNCGFKVDLSAPAAPSGYVYDGGWSPVEPYSTGTWSNDSTKSLTFTIKVKSAAPPDYMDATMTCSPSAINNMECGTSGTVTCSFSGVSHPSELSHSYSYVFDTDLDGSLSDETYRSTSSRSFTFNYNDYAARLSDGSEAISIKGRAKCSGDKYSPEKSNSITLRRNPTRALCSYLTAQPSFGIIPLTVGFTAHIEDSWEDNSACSRPADSYFWTFEPGQSRTTTTPTTTYTYNTEGDFVAVLRATIGGVNLPACSDIGRGSGDNTVNIGPEYWTQSDWNEVAP